jgi:hypothetical protein
MANKIKHVACHRQRYLLSDVDKNPDVAVIITAADCRHKKNENWSAAADKKNQEYLANEHFCQFPFQPVWDTINAVHPCRARPPAQAEFELSTGHSSAKSNRAGRYR